MSEGYSPFAMSPRNREEELLVLLTRHARNILRVVSITSNREVQEFRNELRSRLRENGINILSSLKEIQEEALRRAENVEGKDVEAYEYYMAIYSETTFLLSAIPTRKGSDTPRNEDLAPPASGAA